MPTAKTTTPTINILRTENGAILIWLAFSISLILATLSFLFFSNRQTTSYQQLQTLADASALSGAQQLCPKAICRSQALQSVIDTLNHNFATLSSGYQQIEILNSTETETGYELDTQNNDLTIEVSFGWSKPVPDTISNGDFELIDPRGTWQALNPGIPANLVVNAISIKMTLKNITGLFTTELGPIENGMITVQSHARSGPIDQQVIAPLALPACALVNEEAEFNQAEICYGDRLFTRADRYLPEVTDFQPFTISSTEATLGLGFKEEWSDMEDYFDYYDYRNAVEVNTIRQSYFDSNQFGVRPTLFYEPCSDKIDGCRLDKHLNYNTQSLENTASNRYTSFGGWSNYAYSNLADHYGILGYVDNEKDFNQVDFNSFVQNLPSINLSGAGAATGTLAHTAYIGDIFQINQSGLNQSNWADSFWNFIQRDPQLSKRYDLGNMDPLEQGKIYFSLIRLGGLINLPNFPNLKVAADRPLSFAPHGRRDANLTDSGKENLFFNSARQDPSALTAGATKDNYPTLLRDQFTNGLCPSRRMKLTDFSNPISNNPNTSALTPEQTSLLGRYLGENDNYLLQVESNDNRHQGQDIGQIKIPIIADVRANAASCVDPVTKSKPAIDPNGEYQVIGFIDLNIFDVSYEDSVEDSYLLNKAINTKDLHTNGEESLENITNDNYYDYLKTFHPESDPENPGQTIKMPHILADDRGPKPGHFQIKRTKLDGSTELEAQSCQFVRARAACGTDFIASSQNTGPRQAVVYQPLS